MDSRNIIEISGSHGDLIVDIVTGEIIERQTDEGEEGYPMIVRFNPATLKGECMDILECGYWTADGSYEPPEPDFVAHVENIEAGGSGLL
jgi:hypothetical protein